MNPYGESARYPGFTLIELTLATALAAVLMMGVLGILSGINRDHRMLSSLHASTANPDLAMAVDLFRRDLGSASNLETDGNGTIEIRTTASIDAQTLNLIDRPSVVSYQVLELDGLHALVRRQQLQDEPVTPPSLQTLLALGVNRFEIERLKETPDGSIAAEPQQSPVARNEQGVPRQVRLKIGFDVPDSKSPTAVDQILCLR